MRMKDKFGVVTKEEVLEVVRTVINKEMKEIREYRKDSEEMLEELRNIWIYKEYKKCIKAYDLELEEIKSLIENSCRFTFIKCEIYEKIEKELDKIKIRLLNKLSYISAYENNNNERGNIIEEIENEITTIIQIKLEIKYNIEEV